MEPASTILLAGLTAIAKDACKDGAESLAKVAWGKIKVALGWKAEPPVAEVNSVIQTALRERPGLANELERIVSNYYQQTNAETNTMTKFNAGRDVVNIQGTTNLFGAGTKIGGD